MQDNLIAGNLMPVGTLGTMAEMFEKGKIYEVMVDDRVNAGSKTFSFGLNGRIGEYPTNMKIQLRGEEIQHLYNCTYENAITEETGDGKFQRVVGYQTVCRFAITPTSWGALRGILPEALPERAVLLQKPGVPVYRENANNATLIEAPSPAAQFEPMPEKSDEGMTVDDFMAARQKELEIMSKNDLMSFATERGIEVKNSLNKAAVLDSILKFEEALMTAPAEEE